MAAVSRPRVFMDISIGETPAGRIVYELFSDQVPRTTENFRVLCNGENPTLSYRLSPFHRIIDEFMIQGGDITKGDGTGGVSIYGAEFEDENLSWRDLDAAGLVCMANRGKGTNSSQFFITLEPCPHLNGKHTIFGHVVSGLDVLAKIAKVPVDKDDRPREPVLVARCGELVRNKPLQSAQRQISPASLERGRRRKSAVLSKSPSRSQSRSRSPPVAVMPKEKRKRRQSDNIVDETLRGRPRARSNSLNSIHSRARSVAMESGSQSPLRKSEEDRNERRKREPSPSRGTGRDCGNERSASRDAYERRRRRSLPNQYDDHKDKSTREGESRDGGGERRNDERRDRPRNERRDGRKTDRYTPHNRGQRDEYRGDDNNNGYRGGDKGYGDRRGGQSYRPPPRDNRQEQGRLGGDPYASTSGGSGADNAIKFKGRGSMKFREPDRRW